MFEMLKRLCAASGVSGDEREVCEFIREIAEPLADSVRTDVLGNLIIEKRGVKSVSKKLMVCAHLDEVGVIVTSITDEGFLKFACAGSIDKRILPGKRVFFGSDRVVGIIGTRVIHFVKGAARDKVVSVEDMYIDIGAATREAAEKLISLGDTGAFDAHSFEFGDGLFAAKAIDDRLGCAVMLELLKSDLPCDCTFVFTVQEEVGARGAAAASFAAEPDVALVLEATTAADLPGVPDAKKVCCVGGGAVIPFMDRGTIYNRELWDTLTARATERGIAWQTKQYISGGTDAQVIHKSRAGVATLAVAAPVRNLHSPLCVGKIADFQAVLDCARLFLEVHCERFGI